MSLLLDYENRTSWKHDRLSGRFMTDRGLRQKVDEGGKYLPFHGSTVVFRPGRDCQGVVQVAQHFLSHHLDSTRMLADPLDPAQIHMTLHDLCSPSLPTREGETYADKVVLSAERAAKIVEEIHRDYQGRKIRMVCDKVVSLVSTSIVMLLKPASEKDFSVLMELYRRFDDIAPLPYPLTPHITLAYFRPGEVDGDYLSRVIEGMQFVPGREPAFDFEVGALTAQIFLDMDTYRDLPLRVCFCCDGGIARSVMAAACLNQKAREEGLPVFAEPRCAYLDLEGGLVEERVWEILEDHGVSVERDQRGEPRWRTSRYLREEDLPLFSRFGLLSQGAMEHFYYLGIPEKKALSASHFLFGIPDPTYEVSYEEAFTAIQKGVDRYLAYLKESLDRYRKGGNYAAHE